MSDHQKALKEAAQAFNREKWTDALVLADEYLTVDPTNAEALYIAGTSLFRIDQKGCALHLLSAASQLDPGRPEILINMAACLQENHPEEAYKTLLRAVEASDGNMSAPLASNLINVMSATGRHQQALDLFEKFKHEEECLYNAIFPLLSTGQWKKGFALNARTHGRFGSQIRHKSLPRLSNGKPQRVIVYGEQGIGDQVMYAAKLQDLAASGMIEHAVVEVDPRLEDLFRRSFRSQYFTIKGTLPQSYVDWYSGFAPTRRLEMSGLFEFFAPKPFVGREYLRADPNHVRACRDFIKSSARGRPAVGIAWNAGTLETGRNYRSVPFKLIRMMMDALPDVYWVNVEYDPSEEFYSEFPWAFHRQSSYDVTASFLSALDFVVAPTTSIIDLAGALGVKAIAMVNRNPQWRYSDFAGEDDMWIYPSVKTIRQKGSGWEEVVSRVVDEINIRVSQHVHDRDLPLGR